jgi:hypothetical protein
MAGGIRSICIGQSGCGKTTFTKDLLNRRPKDMKCMIYDVNKEYGEYYNEPLDDFDVFLIKICAEDTRHTFIVCEEATIFFNTQTHSKEMTDLLVRARHTGNIIQLNFHSFGTIPKGIYSLLNFVIVFKTQDSLKSVRERFDHPKVLQAYDEARASEDIHFHKIVKIN